MKKDPLAIILSLLLHLNSLNEDQKFSIHQFKTLSNLDLHWVTIKKYLKIITLIKKYSPEINFVDDSKFIVPFSEVYQRLTEKEKLIFFLFNNHALNADSAISIPTKNFSFNIIDSVGFLYEKTKDNKYYINSAGIELLSSVKSDLTNMIFNEKAIDEIFVPVKESEKSQEMKFKLLKHTLKEKSRFDDYSSYEFLVNTWVPELEAKHFKYLKREPDKLDYFWTKYIKREEEIKPEFFYLLLKIYSTSIGKKFLNNFFHELKKSFILKDQNKKDLTLKDYFNL